MFFHAHPHPNPSYQVPPNISMHRLPLLKLILCYLRAHSTPQAQLCRYNCLSDPFVYTGMSYKLIRDNSPAATSMHLQPGQRGGPLKDLLLKSCGFHY